MPTCLTEKELRDAIVREAKTWTGTKYRDHAGIKGQRKGEGGVDCAYFPTLVYQAVGLIDEDFQPPRYSPQQWLNSPSQVDKFHLRVRDTTMLDLVVKILKRELVPPELPQAGDLMLCKMIESWTHAAIVVEWPVMVLHPVKGRGVIGSHALNEGFWKDTPKRFFTFFDRNNAETEGT
jgi:cell wall-associated NlpC family hydrolase